MNSSSGRRRRSQAVALGVTAVLAAASLTACGSGDDDPQYAGVCVDQQTGERLEDEQCRCVDPENNQARDDDQCRQHRTGSHVSWYFIPFGLAAARIGQRVSGGSYAPPQDRSYVAGGVARGGGTISKSNTSSGTKISRGGFGSRGGAVGG